MPPRMRFPLILTLRCPPKSRLDYTPVSSVRATVRRLLHNGWIVTMDDAGTEHGSGWVLVERIGGLGSSGAGRPRMRTRYSISRAPWSLPGSSIRTTTSTRHSRARGRKSPTSSRGYGSCIPSGRGSTTRRSTPLPVPGWQSWRCPGARPSSTTTTSFRAGRVGSWRRKYRPPASSACGSSPRAGRWISASRPAGCRRTRWWRRQMRCSRQRRNWPAGCTSPRRARWCRSRWRPARRSRLPSS